MGQTGTKKLETDIQTRNDLCVTQNPYGEFDLTGIYTETQSKGGRNVLQNWVTHPVNNIQTLHYRIESIRAGGTQLRNRREFIPGLHRILPDYNEPSPQPY